jgi:2-keto-4-pentenoate hydratase/2-oxohepta-3-ene-1,7-dioic acid hydratase in catechol pathway
MIVARILLEESSSKAATWVIVENDVAYLLEGERFSNPVKGRELGPISSFKLLAPIEQTNNVVGLFGSWVNLNDRDGPGIFIKPSTARINPNESIVIPKIEGRVVFEPELGIVIGKTCKDVSAEEGNDAIFGYTVSNDATNFDITVNTNYPVIAGKYFDTFGPLGPWIVTGLDGANLQLKGRLNGKQLVDINTNQMLWTPQQMVSWVSRIMTLNPGDIISCGTPPGFDTIRPGDTVECEIAEIGVLRNSVV